MKIYLPFLLLAIFACKNNQPSDNKKLEQDLAQDISVLASDSLQGRAPCSLGENRTISYLEKRMKEIGLDPAFDGSFIQEVPLVKITSKVPDVISFKTPNGSLQMKGGSDISVWSPVSQSEVSGRNAEMIFAGFGINAPEQRWNDFTGIDVKGKIIIVLVNDPGFYTSDSTLFKGKTMTYYGRWRYKFEEAERQGAAGCLIIHQEKAAGYPWAIVNRHHNNTEYYLSDENLATAKCKLQGWITSDAARNLFKENGFQLDEMIKEASTRGFKAKPLKTTLSLNIKNYFEHCTSRNVAGIIHGSSETGEAIVYTAHWDHLGIGSVVDGDSIYNGASDNAAAMAWMLAIATEFKKQKDLCNRSVIFLSPTAEESGLLGSDWYVKHPAVPINKTIACFNSDVYLFLGHFNDVTVTGLGQSGLDEILSTETKKQGRYIASDPNPENGMLFRSDQLPFMKAGVPALFAKGYTDQKELGKNKTAEKIKSYWQNIYHKPSDEFDPLKDNLDGLADDVFLFYHVGLDVANSKTSPEWKKGSEFFVERK